jgi:hypothetical protein
MIEDMTSINAFLYFGYVPNPHASRPAWLDGVTSQPIECEDQPSLVSEGVHTLRQVFRDATAGSRSPHVVPLSGGLDSRATLAGLLENVGSREILAVTFGSPGTWDYDIGCEVARVAGVRHETIDLSSPQWKWNTSDLVETAKRTRPLLWIFDVHVNRRIPERLGPGPLYWSGFMGDSLTGGSHLSGRGGATWDEAQKGFIEVNRYVHSVNLTPPGFKPEDCLPTSPLPGLGGLSYEEQLDFIVRQQGLVEPIVLPAGYEYRAPFLDRRWVRFSVSMPRYYRKRQRLYKEILKTAYPRLFSLPVKNNLGLPLEASFWSRKMRKLSLSARALARRLAPNIGYSLSPGLNYIDFSRALRRPTDFAATVSENLRDLKKRGIVDWIDPDDLWRRHRQCRGNYADALTLLASLEIQLKARDEVTP